MEMQRRWALAGARSLRSLLAGRCSSLNCSGFEATHRSVSPSGLAFNARKPQFFAIASYHAGGRFGEHNVRNADQIGVSARPRCFSESAVREAAKKTRERTKTGSKRVSAAENARSLRRPIIIECGECSAMCVTQVLKEPYDHGVVFVRCTDCWSPNLVSDRLNLFQENGSMEKFLVERGVDVRNGPERLYELTAASLSKPSSVENEEQVSSAETEERFSTA